MPHVLVIHEVEDYGAWKVAFDAAGGLLEKAGELEFQVLVDAGNPNRVVHFARWTSLDSARAFFASPEVAEIRRKAGVRAPEFVYLVAKDAGSRGDPV